MWLTAMKFALRELAKFIWSGAGQEDRYFFEQRKSQGGDFFDKKITGTYLFPLKNHGQILFSVHCKLPGASLFVSKMTGHLFFWVRRFIWSIYFFKWYSFFPPNAKSIQQWPALSLYLSIPCLFLPNLYTSSFPLALHWSARGNELVYRLVPPLYLPGV